MVEKNRWLHRRLHFLICSLLVNYAYAINTDLNQCVSEIKFNITIVHSCTPVADRQTLTKALYDVKKLFSDSSKIIDINGSFGAVDHKTCRDDLLHKDLQHVMKAASSERYVLWLVPAEYIVIKTTLPLMIQRRVHMQSNKAKNNLFPHHSFSYQIIDSLCSSFSQNNGKSKVTRSKRSVIEQVRLVNARVRGPRFIIVQSNHLEISWHGSSSPFVTDYQIHWNPPHGYLKPVNESTTPQRTILGLQPSHLYRITITPLVAGNKGFSQSFLQATAPILGINSSSDLRTKRNCKIKRRLHTFFRKAIDGNEETDECQINNVKKVIQVQSDNYTSNKNPPTTFEVYTKMATTTSTQFHQTFNNPKPGESYTVTVFENTEDHENGATESVVLIPPLRPLTLQVSVVNSSTVAINWDQPISGRFDSFVIKITSAFGSKVIRVKPVENPQMEKNASKIYYNYILANLRPDTIFQIEVKASSYGVLSSPVAGHFRTAKPLFVELPPVYVLATEDGVYLGDRNGNRKQVVFESAGVVDALYHRKWLDNSWLQMLVWIDRKSRSIKLSNLSNGDSTTLVSGSDVLQPNTLCFDQFSGNLYWSDITAGTIGVANIHSRTKNFKIKVNLVEGINQPTSITIDVVSRVLYWSDIEGVMWKSNMDGSDIHELNSKIDISVKYSLNHCHQTNSLYWIDSSLDVINQYGLSTTVIKENIFGNASVSMIDNSHVYVINIEQNHLTVYNKISYAVEQEYDLGMNVRINSIKSNDEKAYEIGITSTSERLEYPCSHDTMCSGVCIPTSIGEAACINTCKSWEIMCFQNNISVCISKQLECDGKINCDDAEDEHDCEFEGECEESSFQCKGDGNCVSYNRICDGRIDCKDGSDESSCPDYQQICSFEDSFCLWSFDHEASDYRWSLSGSSTKSAGTGPLLDATRTDNSNFIFAEATNQNEGDIARLISVYFNNPVCIKFKYHMYGKGMGSLRLLSLTENEEEAIWSKSGSQGIFWLNARVSVNKQQLHRLVFEAERGIDFRSDIAIDDIIISNGLCSIEEDCIFRNNHDNFCGYQKSSGWSVGSGEVTDIKLVDVGTGLYSDHQDISDTMGPQWFFYNFEYDQNEDCTDCNGRQIVRNISHLDYGVKYVGVVLCDVTKYKIYLGDELGGLFLNVADGVGNGQDHCEFLGSKQSATAFGTFRECGGPNGYIRQRWGEPVTKGAFGFQRSVFFSPSYYVCDIEFPEYAVEARFKEDSSNMFLFTDGNMDYNQNVNIKIPISKPLEQKTAQTENIHKFINLTAIDGTTSTYEVILPTGNPSTYWCLKFSYFIINPSERDALTVNLDSVFYTSIWKRNHKTKGWKNASVSLPYPYIKYEATLLATSSGASIGVKNVKLKQSQCNQPEKYHCSFSDPMTTNCQFLSPIKDNIVQVVVDPLYERNKFEPFIVKDIPHRGGIITANPQNTASNNTVLTSSKMTKLTRHFPNMCITVKYKQVRKNGGWSIAVRGANSKKEYVFVSETVKDTVSITPWLLQWGDIDEDIAIANEEDFYIEIGGLDVVWLNEVSIHMVSCAKVLENVCRSKIKCSNGACVSPENLCDNRNDCGDWSDEIGCNSGCNSIADYFEPMGTLLDLATIGHDCQFRIHAAEGAQIALIISKPGLDNSKAELSVTSNEFEDKPLFSLTELTDEQTTYVITGSLITLNFRLVSSIVIHYEVVGTGYCSLVCPDYTCLQGNYPCDGKPGCLDGSDEEECTQIISENDNQIFKVKRINEEFQPICASDVNVPFANGICQQMGHVRAKTPLKFHQLSPQYNISLLYRLNHNVTKQYPFFIQSYITSETGALQAFEEYTEEKKQNAGRLCDSDMTWSPQCIPFTCGVRPQMPSLKIVGGKRSQRGLWPWVASFTVRGRHSCGGTVISDRIVLTAAHCFDNHDPEEFVVYLATINLDNLKPPATKYKVEKGIIHSEYDRVPSTPLYDIAIVFLETTIRYSEMISPICITGERFLPGHECTIAGYGNVRNPHTTQSFLHDVSTKIIPNEQCSMLYSNGINPNVLCGLHKPGGKGICHGDSGGPLMCQSKQDGSWHLAGIASWSVGCARKGKPDVFTRITSYIPWINEHTGLNLTVPSKQVVNGTCGGVFYGKQQGVFASPNWPNNYPPSVNCHYVILADLGQKIAFSFERFSTEPIYDTVSIYNASINGNKLQTSSGSKIPSNLFIQTTALHIVFQSDSGLSTKGFIAQYSIIGEKQNYRVDTHILELKTNEVAPEILNLIKPYLGFYFPQIKEFGRPHYMQIHLTSTTNVVKEMQYFPSSGTWNIAKSFSNSTKAPNYGIKSMSVSLTPDKVEEEWKIWDGRDWFGIKVNFVVHKNLQYDATYGLSSIVGTDVLEESGFSPLRKKRSLVGEANNHLGRLTVTTTCPGTIRSDNVDGTQYIITSPRYPRKYPAASDCAWEISVVEGKRIQLTFTHFGLEAASLFCKYDNLTLYNGRPNQNTISRHCGSVLPEPVISRKNLISIIFQSDLHYEEKGFRLVAKSVDGQSGTIEEQNSLSPRQLLYCDFEHEDECDFYRDISDFSDFQWRRHRLDTPSGHTGPPHDDSSDKTGYYMYIEASSPREAGDRATLITPLMTPVAGAPVCVQFSYDMFGGSSVGSLNVYSLLSPYTTGEDDKSMRFLLSPVVQKFGSGLDQGKMNHPFSTEANPYPPAWQRFLIWSRVGDQRKSNKPWNKAKITMHVTQPFYLIFEAIRGATFQSDIALDNVIVTSGECRKKECEDIYEFTCNNKECKPTETTCDGQPDCTANEDESLCHHSVQTICNEMSYLPNTTEWYLCQSEILPKCSLTTNDVTSIACNGVYDCFGGHDEAFCTSHVNRNENIEAEKDASCGFQPVFDEKDAKLKITKSNPDNWPWVTGLYLKMNGYNSDEDYDEIDNGSGNEEKNIENFNDLIFLCSAIFVKDLWIVAPAHCLINNKVDQETIQRMLYPEEATDYENDQGKFSDYPLIPDGAEAPEFEDWNYDEESTTYTNVASEENFSYYIKKRMPDGSSKILKVVKIIPHPQYTKEYDTPFEPVEPEDVNFKKRSQIWESIKLDIMQMNNDVILIRVDDNNNMRSMPKACVNKLTTVSNNLDTSAIFKLATESPPKNPLINEKISFCYAVGHSLNYDINTEGSLQGEFSVSHMSVPMVLADISTQIALCSMQQENKSGCVEELKKDPTALHSLILAGYERIALDHFEHDEGVALMCQSWDNRWYLFGMYNWLNLHRNAMSNKLYPDNFPEVKSGFLRNDLVIGQPENIAMYSNIENVADWIKTTLDDDCPGEFACYRESSGYKQKCISNQKLCDGTIDCLYNYADEINCLSGCFYNKTIDEFRNYYDGLLDHHISIPSDVMDFTFDAIKNPKSSIIANASYNSNNEIDIGTLSWRNESTNSRIRVNSVQGQFAESCRWSIKAPMGKVAVLRIPPITTWPIVDGGVIKVISSDGEVNEVKQRLTDSFYVSEPGGILSLHLLPHKDQLLKNLHLFNAFYYMEPIGECTGQYKCDINRCLPLHMKCNGVLDCVDQSDELNCPSGCGSNSVIIGPTSGEITSRNYPLPFNGRGECLWIFTPNQSSQPMKLILDFIDFKTNPLDVLYIFKGANKKRHISDLIAVYHGVLDQNKVTLDLNAPMTFMFQGNDYVESRAVKIQYEITL